MKSFKAENYDFILNIPDDWVITQEKNIVSTYDTDHGVGVLQFSIYNIDESKDLSLSDELEEHLKNKYDDLKISLENNFAYCKVVDKNEIYWEYWLLRKKATLVFVTYNCANTDIEIENDMVRNIILSVIQ